MYQYMKYLKLFCMLLVFGLLYSCLGLYGFSGTTYNYLFLGVPMIVCIAAVFLCSSKK